MRKQNLHPLKIKCNECSINMDKMNKMNNFLRGHSLKRIFWLVLYRYGDFLAASSKIDMRDILPFPKGAIFYYYFSPFILRPFQIISSSYNDQVSVPSCPEHLRLLDKSEMNVISCVPYVLMYTSDPLLWSILDYAMNVCLYKRSRQEALLI